MFMLKVFFAFSTLLIAPSLGELSELSKEVFRGCRRNYGLHFCFSLFKDARDCVEIISTSSRSVFFILFETKEANLHAKNGTTSPYPRHSSGKTIVH